MITDGLGVAISLADIVWRCYSQCELASSTFGDLYLDLHSLHAALLAVRPLLPEGGDFSALKTGIEKIVSDITKLLSRHDSLGTMRKRLWQRFSWASADTDQLRSRVIAQSSLLTLYLTATNTRCLRGYCSHGQNHDRLPQSNQPTHYSSKSDEQTWNVVCEKLRNLDAPGSSVEAVELPALERQIAELPSSYTPSPPASAVTLVTIHNNQKPLSIDGRSAFSDSTSSIASSERQYHSLSTTLKAKLKRPRKNFIAAAKGGDVVTLLSIVNDRVQRSQLDRESINKALIEVSSNEKREREQTAVIGHLLDQNAELEYKDDHYGRTPLIWAVTVGREDIVDFLLDRKALVETTDEVADRTPLMWAVWWGNEAIIRRLIRGGACLSAVDGIWKRTALLWAAKRGTYGAAEILLQTERGRELIEVKDKEQLTPLVLAYVEGHEHVAATLLKHDANKNSTLPSGVPVLISAITNGDLAFVRLLITNGADIHCTNKEGIPALSVAVREEHPSLAEFLITERASLEKKDAQGRTALVWAIGRASEDLVALLLKSGADRFAMDAEGRTVREWAELTQNARIIALVSSGEG